MSQPSSLILIQTVWSCVFWQRMMKTMLPCRSTSPSCSPSAVTAASRYCGFRGFSGSSSCWELWMQTEIRRSVETFTACWLRTLKQITADYKRWEPTAKKAAALTSGCLNWSFKNAEGSRHPRTYRNCLSPDAVLKYLDARAGMSSDGFIPVHCPD